MKKSLNKLRDFFIMYRLCRWLNLLSLDVVAGAMVSALFFAKVFQVRLLPYGVAALGLSVWIIYTVDHLYDSMKIKEPVTTRHTFHQQNFRILALFVAVAIACVVVLIFYIRKPVLYAGIILGMMAASYLVVASYLRFFKELLVAMIYSAGVLLPSLAVTQIEISLFHGILIAQFLIIAYMNLLLFSWFDLEDDISQGQNSFTTKFGRQKTLRLIISLAIINTILTFVMMKYEPLISLITATMSGTLILILIFHRIFIRNTSYRMLGDAVFLVPMLYLL